MGAPREIGFAGKRSGSQGYMKHCFSGFGPRGTGLWFLGRAGQSEATPSRPHFPSQPLQLEREERRRGTCAEPRSRTWGAQCEEAEVSSICKARSCPGPAQQPVCLFLCLHREAAVGGPPRGSLASPRHRGQGPLLFTRPVGTCHTRGPASASAREPAGRA